MIDHPNCDDAADQAYQKPSNICEVQNGIHRFIFRIPDDPEGQQLLMDTALQYAHNRDIPFAFSHAQSVIVSVQHYHDAIRAYCAGSVQLTGDRKRTIQS